MKKTLMLIPLAFAALVSCNDAPKTEETKTTTDTTVATTKAETPAPPPMDSATAAKKYQEFMTPGDMHKMMAASVGKWTTESTMWMDEKAPPMKSTGTAEGKMILGGRYLTETHKGEMMGMPFEGVATTGYDNAEKVFVSTWQDNMGTSIMMMKGTYDDATKTLTMKGECTDPVRGKMAIRQTLKFVDEKTQVMEMYGTPEGGKEMKSMEMKMVKK